MLSVKRSKLPPVAHTIEEALKSGERQHAQPAAGRSLSKPNLFLTNGPAPRAPRRTNLGDLRAALVLFVLKKD